jgi:hypothetical protein
MEMSSPLSEDYYTPVAEMGTNHEVCKAVLMTEECGQNYKLIDDKNMGKMREMTRDLTTTVFSDGWTTVNHRPIVNINMGVRSLHTLRASIDTMGQEKTKVFKVLAKDAIFLEWLAKQPRVIPISSRYMLLCATLRNFAVYLLN